MHNKTNKLKKTGEGKYFELEVIIIYFILILYFVYEYIENFLKMSLFKTSLILKIIYFRALLLILTKFKC